MHANAYQRFAAIAEQLGIGDRHNLHHARIFQSLDAAAHSRFRESNFFGNGPVGPAAIELEQTNDLTIDPVQAVRGRNEFQVRTFDPFCTLTFW